MADKMWFLRTAVSMHLKEIRLFARRTAIKNISHTKKLNNKYDGIKNAA